MLKITLLLVLIGLCSSTANDGITCQFCRVQLASMTESIQGNQQTMAQMGDSFSQGCDQVPNADVRNMCRLTLDDNFPLYLTEFLQQPDTTAQDYCTQMGYCV